MFLRDARNWGKKPPISSEAQECKVSLCCKGLMKSLRIQEFLLHCLRDWSEQTWAESKNGTLSSSLTRTHYNWDVGHNNKIKIIKKKTTKHSIKGDSLNKFWYRITLRCYICHPKPSWKRRMFKGMGECSAKQMEENHICITHTYTVTM